MKSKMLIVTLFVGLVSQQWAASQTETDSVATNEPAMSEIAPASQPAITVATPEATDTVATDTNESSDAASSSETASVSMPITVSTNVLPVQFQDVPLTTAIENLARLAGINYLLDPQIGYGQPDQSGKIKPEPTISVRWENITAQQALTAVLDNYGLQAVEDPKTKITRITIQNPNAPQPLITRVFQLKYASVSNIQAAVESVLTDPSKRSKVMPDSRTSQLVVVATEKEQDAVDTLIGQLDKPTRQVLIEAQMFQMSSSPSTIKGIDWSGTLAGQNISFGNGQVQAAQTTFTAPGTPVTTTLPSGATITTTPGYTTATTMGSSSSSGSGSGSSSSSGSGGSSGGLIPNGLSWNTLSGFSPAIGFLNADGLHAVLSFLSQDSDAEIISTPRIVTLDNQPASINSGLRQPIRDITASTANTTAGSTVTYEDIGTILVVTPRISANDYIHLSVMVTNRNIVGYESYSTPGGGGGRDPVTQNRNISTLVLIRNANTLVMGGLINDSIGNTYTKVPLFGDIPVLGYAFRSESKTRKKENMLIFITPTIVRETDFQPTETQFLRARPPKLKGGINPNSIWNSGRPYDWSRPKESSNP
jgi:type II secretory pathway component GspD/PulD (secretin)